MKLFLDLENNAAPKAYVSEHRIRPGLQINAFISVDLEDIKEAARLIQLYEAKNTVNDAYKKEIKKANSNA